MTKIFISYSSKDEGFVRQLAASLHGFGVDLWLDIQDIPAGMKWSTEVQQGLTACELMLLIISPESMASRNVEDEWQFYLDHNKPIIPILLRPTEIHFQLNRLQRIDFHKHDYDTALNQLHAELRRKGITLHPTNANTQPSRTFEPPKIFSGDRGHVYSVAFSPDDKMILTSSVEKVSLWDIRTGKVIRQFLGHRSDVRCVAFSPDGRYVVTGSTDHTARIWLTASGEELAQLIGHTEAIYCVAFSPHGNYILTSSRDSTARLWNTAQAKEIYQFAGHRGGIWCGVFSHDGSNLLTGSSDPNALLWTVSSGIVHEFKGHSKDVRSVAFSPDGKLILTGSIDTTARLWDITTGEEIQQVSWSGESIFSAVFSPDGHFVLTGSDQAIRLWRTTTGEMIREVDKGYMVERLTFSPSGKYILAGCADNTARLWESGL